MNLYRKLKDLHKEYMTFMIVPHSGSNIKQFHLKKTFYYLFLSISAVLCTSIIILTVSLIQLNHRLDVNLNNLKKLQAINKDQSLEIADLKNKTSFVNEKLSILNDLENQVRSLVGLKAADSQSTKKPISRSALRYATGVYEEIEVSDDLSMNESLDILATEMDQKMENLSDLIDDVSDQLKVLAATPDKMPTEGRITSKFGYRKSPLNGRREFHSGLDIANKQGTEILAAGNGIITFSGWNAGYGNTVIISHGHGYRSVYAHNKENLVEVGQRIQKGDVIAKMGSTGRSTGSHLHFEIHYNGEQINPEKVLKP
ncbi:M23 family metallopeptidase [Geosporobacter ferrireducens]|uniref:M23ase beta-sheet core domain-containing protein n=1 Tax=Geosporobacter ferrireducens TaxID=1424294 RepID=A0A1D8GP81_9FIRM|nr:M23 family metallopeptidase [Geosporobacter ferrireducens]AOT72688.1 hypothetical protein Gferi_25910 [Geosporobacter ferrireducens]